MLSNLFGFFSSSEDPLGRLLNEAASEDVEVSIRAFIDILNYVPRENNRIINKSYEHIVTTLASRSTTPELRSAILNLLYGMIKRESPEHREDLVSTILSNPRIASALLICIRYPSKQLYSICKTFINQQPDYFNGILSTSKTPLLELIKTLTPDSPKHAWKLLLLLLQTYPNVLKSVEDQLMNHLDHLPLGLVIPLMESHPEIKDGFTSPIDLLLNSPHITIHDIEQAVHTWPEIWFDSAITDVFLKAECDEGFDQFHWMANQPPQSFDIKVDDMDLNGIEHIFVAFYVLSFADPHTLNHELIEEVLESLNEENEWIIAAALQLLIIWVLKHKLELPSKVLFKAAFMVQDQGQSSPLSTLLRLFLRSYGSCNQISVSLITTEDGFDVESDELSLLLHAPWTFPHFRNVPDAIMEIELIDFTAALKVTGILTNYLGLVE